ncbi:fungal-specific transcription factor domain-domain-containing protein [Lobosporangium transversale]|uniref:Fungal-specific transcription factor domain-domain-containing protein n=1 Tax=Lobosporangium transversale TaxID=64571 RepID=A0A1Y2GEL5_9FUNG|nr:fungal-specific transcription factor domain-domain-containing protein [Lobosporangium transversale]ORZ08765.1 fungal-specific transcription factor domain-domain-containing protein [Lobosporangium transversale]|eukprot:XP_021878548.1 fungal-specific transcription factor domain-domain-containing protein [Lobosporangium transversale]
MGRKWALGLQINNKIKRALRYLSDPSEAERNQGTSHSSPNTKQPQQTPLGPLGPMAHTLQASPMQMPIFQNFLQAPMPQDILLQQHHQQFLQEQLRQQQLQQHLHQHQQQSQPQSQSQSQSQSQTPLLVQSPPSNSIQDINTCIDDLESKHTHNTLVYIMESLKLNDNNNQAGRKAYDLVVEKKSEDPNSVPPPEISLPSELTLPTRSTDLPSIEIRDHLVDTYFTYRYPIWPIIHKTIFLSQLHDPNSTPSLLLLNALFAYASRYSSWQVLRSDPDKPETAGQLFLERAQTMLPAFLMAPRLSTVQALLFLAQLEDNATQRHTYHSMAVRMAQLLDLHKSCQHMGLPDDERETRRCIWWTCYMNDRLLALSTRKPAIIHDGDCNIDLPFQEHIYDGPGNNSVSLSHYYSPPQLFHQLLLLSKIVGGVLKHFTKVANKRYRSPDAHELALTALDESLFTWLASLPDHLQYNPGPDSLTTKTLPSPYVAALHLYFYSILHTLHNPYMDSSNPRATNDMPKSSPSLERCTLAASMITSLSRSLCFQPQYGLNFGTQCYAILHAAIMHLTNTANTTSYQSLKSKSQFISTLSVIKAYSQHYAFEGVKKSSDVMDNIYNWQVARQQEDSPSPSLGQSTPSAASSVSVSSPNQTTIMREVKHPDHHHVLHHLHHPYLRSESTPSSPRLGPNSSSGSSFPSLCIPSSPAPTHESVLTSRTRSPHAWQLSHSNSVATSLANTPTNIGSPLIKPEGERTSRLSAGMNTSNFRTAVNCSSEPTPESQALLSDIYSQNPTITFDNGRVSPLDQTSLGAILGFELPHSANEEEDNAYWNAQANSLGGMDGWNQQLMTAQEHVSYKSSVGGPTEYLGGNNSLGSLEAGYLDALGAANGIDFSGFGVGATGTSFGTTFGNPSTMMGHNFVFQTQQQREQEQRQQQQQQQQQQQHSPLFSQTSGQSQQDASQMFIKQEPFQFSQDLVNQVYQKTLSVMENGINNEGKQSPLRNTSASASPLSDMTLPVPILKTEPDIHQQQLLHRQMSEGRSDDTLGLDMHSDTSSYFNSPLDGLDTTMEDIAEETW